MFSSDSMSKKHFFQQLKTHECVLSFSTSLFWNGWKTMVQKCQIENESHFPYLPFLIPININFHPYVSLDFKNNLYFQETRQTNATIIYHLWKKIHHKGRFPCKKQAMETILATELWGKNLEKVNSFILEQIRIIEFCPFGH